MKNKIYKKISKTTGITHFGKGLNHLKEARDQINDPANAALSYQEAIRNLEIAHDRHLTSNEIKTTLEQAHRELSLLDNKIMNSSQSLNENTCPSEENIIEAQFFTKNLLVPKNNLLLSEDDTPNNTLQLACELRQSELPDKQKELIKLARQIIIEFVQTKITESDLVNEVIALS
ncbi:1054_t:CDS:1, partial [Gigaspora rosea]